MSGRDHHRDDVLATTLDLTNKGDFMTVYQDVLVEIEATFAADLEENDYGVAGSPRWRQAENTRIESLSIGKTTWTRTELDAALKADGVAVLEELFQVDDDNWF